MGMRIPLTTTPGLVVVVELLGVVKPAQLPEAFPSSDTVGVGRLKAEVSIAGSISNLGVRGEERYLEQQYDS